MFRPEHINQLDSLSHRHVNTIAIEELKTKLRGTILLPDHDSFEEARKVFNRAIDKTPLLIAQCRDVADVMNCVHFARIHQLLIAVRGGGHSVAGSAVCDQGIVIDFSRMKSIRVDPQHQTACAEPGVTWGELDHETQAHGLATTGGTISSVGIAGLTLGGGIGWLTGKYGLTCDNLLSADVVTANGEFITANATVNPELFWALRGGGGNFGIVTSFQYRLHPVGQVLAGTVSYPLESALEVIQFYRSFNEAAPDELTANVSLATLPNAGPVVSIELCYVGSITEGEKLLRPLRAFSSPVEDLIQPMSYCDLQSMSDIPFHTGLQSYWKSSFLLNLDDDAINTIILHFQCVPSRKTVVFIEHFHGAARRVAEDETAFSHRSAKYIFLIASNWSHTAEAQQNKQWSQDFFDAMQPYLMSKAYVNYLGEEGQGQAQKIYGVEKYERLIAVKNKYDPTNIFRVNCNINSKI